MTSTPVLRLPMYHTSLIGRTTEVVELTERLRDSSTRLLTLVGASGAGKTRLALEAAAAASSHFTDGVVFVALAPVQDTRFVIPTIATMLNLTEQPQTTLLSTLGESLRDRHLLLILDNVEQVHDAAADLVTLLAIAPQLTCLLTSQVPIEVELETVYTLPPLALPADDGPHSLDDLMTFAAPALFVERIRDVQPHFHLAPANAPAVLELCRLLQGYPLAIELVAAHSAVLAPADLVVLVRNHLKLLPISRSDASSSSSRSALFHPVLDWCASRLPAATRHLFEQLGIFWGGCTAEAVRAVLMPEQDVETVMELLALLVQKHMIQIETLPGQGDRYVLLDAVHEYSTTRMARRKQEVRLRCQHAEYYQALALALEPQLVSHEQARLLRGLDEEIHNVRIALDWLRLQDQPLAVVRTLTATFRFWLSRSYYTEARYWLELAIIPAPDTQQSDWARGWWMLGVMAVSQRDYTSAEHAYAQAQALYLQAKDWSGQGRVANGRAISYLIQGLIEEARESFEAAITAFRQAPVVDGVGLAAARSNLAIIYMIQGVYNQAEAILEDLLASKEENGDLHSYVNTIGMLIELDLDRGRYTSAKQRWTVGERIAEQLGDLSMLALAKIYLCQGAIEQQLYAEAREHLDAAKAYYKDAPPPPQTVALLNSCAGKLALGQGDWETAERLLTMAQQQYDAIGVHDDPEVDLFLCMLHFVHHEYAAAWEALRRFLEVAINSKALSQMIRGGEQAAIVLVSLDRPEATAALWHAAAALRQQLEIPHRPRMGVWYAEHAATIVRRLEAVAPATPAEPLPVLLRRLLTLPPS